MASSFGSVVSENVGRYSGISIRSTSIGLRSDATNYFVSMRSRMRECELH